MKYNLRKTMKVKNISDIIISIIVNNTILRFKPGEIKEIPNDYIFIGSGELTVGNHYLKVIENLEDLLETPFTRFEIMDI